MLSIPPKAHALAGSCCHLRTPFCFCYLIVDSVHLLRLGSFSCLGFTMAGGGKQACIQCLQVADSDLQVMCRWP